MTHFNFLWSKTLEKDQPDTLQTGFHRNDLSKIFMLKDLENQKRFRQFANFVEMSSFKIWQKMGIPTFRNYTLIILHLMNCLLLWFILRKRTANGLAGLLFALMFLNSGVAFSTLLFPSRIQKILLTSLFLWALSAGSLRSRWLPGHAREGFFYLLLFLMLFTDEMAIILIPLLWVCFFLEKDNPLVRWRALVLMPVLLISYGVTIFIFSSISSHMGQGAESLIPGQIQLLKQSLTHGAMFKDTGRAFFLFFLRRSFGYWDLSLWGRLAGIGFVSIFVIVASHAATKAAWRPFFLFLAAIFLKSFLFPHPHGVHPYIMPSGVTFPSLLFFNYQYTYLDTALFLLAIGFLSNPVLFERRGVVLFLLIMVGIINTSNVIHADEGIKDAINRHNYYVTGQGNVPKVVAVSQVIPLTKKGPVYLSFPSGSHPVFIRNLSSETGIWDMDPEAQEQQLLPDFIDYSSMILAQYLKFIEEGRFIISLQNVKGAKISGEIVEIARARYFYDVREQSLVDLSLLRNLNGNPRLLSAVTKKDQIEEAFDFDAANKADEFVFFVKGAARVVLKQAEHEIEFRQNYGYSYQMFRLQDKDWKQGMERVTLGVYAATPDSLVTLWGPFVYQGFQEQDGKIRHPD